MATTKKTTKKPATKPASRTTTKSAAPRKSAATAAKKAPVVKKAVQKKPAAKKTASAPRKRSAAKASEMRSFRVSRDHQKFTSFQVTKQTVYWIILVAFIIFVQLWILKLQVEVVTLLDAQQAQLVEP